MPKRWIVLICVVSVSAIVVGLFWGLQKEEPCVICDPVYELREKLQLTDEQVETIETGTGTLQLTTEQVDIISDPVEELLNELEPLLDETRWQEVEDVFERLSNSKILLCILNLLKFLQIEIGVLKEFIYFPLLSYPAL